MERQWTPAELQQLERDIAESAATGDFICREPDCRYRTSSREALGYPIMHNEEEDWEYRCPACSAIKSIQKAASLLDKIGEMQTFIGANSFDASDKDAKLRFIQEELGRLADRLTAIRQYT